MKAIQDNNRLYNFLSPLVQFGTRCHYQSFTVRGLENLPTDGAYIIAPCHQQALMEPLAVLCFAPKPPVFLARADIFRKPLIRAILTFLKILPVYRIRDGQSNLTKNNEIFDKSRDVLLDGFPLCLMAEGRHNDRHHLLNMGKGMFRIAGETQLKLGTHPLYIVPTGIDFDEYERPFSNLVVNIGKPIAVQPYMSNWHDNEAVALNQMRQALAEHLSPLMHDIRDEEHYNEIFTLCNILNPTMRRQKSLKNNAWNRFRMRQEITALFDSKEASKPQDSDAAMQRNSETLEKARQYAALCRKLHISQKALPDRWSLPLTLLSVAALAAFLAATVLWAPLRWIVLFCLLSFPILFIPTHLLIRRLIADPQFRSSVNFGVRFLLTILYTIVIAIVVACGDGLWMSRLADLGAWWGVVPIALAHIGALLEASVVNLLKAIARNSHLWLLHLLRPKKIKALKETLQSISATL